MKILEVGPEEVRVRGTVRVTYQFSRSRAYLFGLNGGDP